MKSLVFSSLLLLSLLAACKKDDTPEPVEQELITTVELRVTRTGQSTADVYRYKVQNGFGSTSPGTLEVDTLALPVNATFAVHLRVLNESASPVDDITDEIISEKDAHLFLFASNPATGAGSVAVIGGSTDGQGLPFNQTVQFATGTSGAGSLTVTLLHEPTNKSAATPGAAGGETDLEAIFPVHLIN